MADEPPHFDDEVYVQSIGNVRAELWVELAPMGSDSWGTWSGRLTGSVGWARRYDSDSDADIQLGVGDIVTLVFADDRVGDARVVALGPADADDLYRGNILDVVGIGRPPFGRDHPDGGPEPSGDRVPRGGGSPQRVAKIALDVPSSTDRMSS